MALEAPCIRLTHGGGRASRSVRAKPPQRMNAYQELTHFAGFDWAKEHHDVIIVDLQGQIVADFQFSHSASGWEQLAQKIAAFPRVGVAIETSFGCVVEHLLDTGVSVYPINPASARSYCQRKSPSGNKTDRHDAWALADALRTDGHQWRQLAPADPLIAELRILCRDESALIEERTALLNQLQQTLHEFYPTALEAFDDWSMKGAWAFVLAFPDAETLTKAGKRKWDNFLHSHRLFRPETYEKRIAVFEAASQWKPHPHLVAAKRLLAIARCKQLQVLQAQLDEYRKRIEALFASHPDSSCFGSLPGAGPTIAPRLLSEIGSDRARYDSVEGLQCVAGTAPVSFQSGKIKKVKIRRACNKNLRQAMYLLADHSRTQCTWASLYYQNLIERGKSHSLALRSLGQRWLKIIWKMWQTHSCYDPELHLNNQRKHGSWILNFQPS